MIRKLLKNPNEKLLEAYLASDPDPLTKSWVISALGYHSPMVNVMPKKFNLFGKEK